MQSPFLCAFENYVYVQMHSAQLRTSEVRISAAFGMGTGYVCGGYEKDLN